MVLFRFYHIAVTAISARVFAFRMIIALAVNALLDMVVAAFHPPSFRQAWPIASTAMHDRQFMMYGIDHEADVPRRSAARKI